MKHCINKLFTLYIFLLLTHLAHAAPQKSGESQYFFVRQLNAEEKARLLEKEFWKPGCPVSLERLRVVKFIHHTFDLNAYKDGTLIVMDAAAQHVLKIVKSLYRNKFPIKNTAYDTDYVDTIAFNCRNIINTEHYSIHSYGLAIDLNPIQNPAIVPATMSDGSVTASILPPDGQDYMNRTNLRQGMIEQAGTMVINAFNRHGFTVWGGKWNNPIDWMHFQTPSSLAFVLGIMPPLVAEDFFNLYIKQKMSLFALLNRNTVVKFLELFRLYPAAFVAQIKAKPEIMNGTDQEAAYQELLSAITKIERHVSK